MNRPAATLYVVDDEKNITDNLLEYVEDFAEFRGRAFATAEEALAAMGEDPPHACIVDMRLPGMDGAEFVIRAKASRPDCVIVIHTGSISMNLSDDLRNAGLTEQDIFYKPTDMGMILDRIRSRLGM